MTPDRFFSLLLALQSRHGITTAQLADRLGVSARTVIRDIQWLQEAGFPVHVQRGRTGGVTLLPGGALDISRLTPSERDHLTLNGLDDRQRQRLGTAADSERARQKVAPAKTAQALLSLSEVVTTDNQPWFEPESDHGVTPAELVADLRRGVRLRLRYRRSAEPQPTWCVVDPYGLLAKAGRWYLVADEHAAPRLFLLGRISEWRPLRSPRRLRSGATLHSVAAQLTSKWEAPGGIAVHCELNARQLDRAQRILGSRMTVHEPVAEGRIRITVACRELEAVRQLLQFGDHMTVVDPPEARTRIRELAAQTLQQYG